MMATKRLKVRRKNLPYLKCTFRVYPYEFIGAEILIRYKDTGICRVLPFRFCDVMDETDFANVLLPNVKKAFFQLKEVIGDGE